MAETRFLDKTGLTQVIGHLQKDTDERITQAIEDVIFAGDSDESVDNLPYLDAEKLNGYTSDDFVKVADLGTTTVGLATADADGNVISETYAKNSDMNSGFVSLQSQIDTKVDKTTTVNGKALASSITITAADVGADAQGAAANALKEAKTYAEGQASSTLISAKAYTDTETTSAYSAAKTYAEEQAASALKSAKTYADTTSATALSDAKEYNDAAYANANAYTDKKIADLINGAPTTLDTLGEIATAMNNNADVVEALNEAIGTKANSADLANYVSVSDYLGESKVSVGVAENKNLDVIYFEFSDGTKKLLKYDNATKRLGFTEFDGSMWRGNDIAYTADLANYLSLTGGTLTGSLKQSANKPILFLNDTNATIDTGIAIDTNADKLRIFEYGSSCRGVNLDISKCANNSTSELLHTGNSAKVATSGSYNDLTNKPTIPTNTNQLTNGAGFITSSGSITGNAATATTASYLKTPMTTGYLTDQYGNFAHQGEGVEDNFNIFNNAKDKSLRYVFETGNLSIPGTMTASAFSGNASTATALTSSAGSATQPVYFSNGKPVATTYTLGKSVPSDAVFTDTNTWRPLGTTADTACAGNDARLSNARPASDVYSWAKASTKPSYSWSEITSKPSVMTANGITPAVDCDTIITNGSYYVSPSTTNTPGNYGEMLVMHNADTTGQLYIPYTSNGESLQYRGANDSGGFYPWRTVIDSSNISSQSVNYANSAGNASSATVAAKLGANGNINAPMTFIWSGQSGQPTWLWGGDSYENMYPYNPSNFSVNYANSAGTISNQGSAATKDIVHTTTDPGAGTASSYKEGSIICVYE